MEPMQEPLHTNDSTAWAVWADWLEEHEQPFQWAGEVSEGLKSRQRLFLVAGVVWHRSRYTIHSMVNNFIDRNLAIDTTLGWVGYPLTGEGNPLHHWTSTEPEKSRLDEDLLEPSQVAKFPDLARKFFETVRLLWLEDKNDAAE